MKTWVTGGGGFVGWHLGNYLLNRGETVLSTYFPASEGTKKVGKDLRYEKCDLRNKERVYQILKEFMPERIFHLAAQSFPTVSWEDPRYTMDVNVGGTINIFEGLKEFKLNSKVLNICSSAEYGFVDSANIPVKETHSLKPLHPYGVSKAAQEMLAYQYFKNFGIESVSIRLFNTTGPGKVNDLCADLTKRLIEIEKEINPDKILRVGNLATGRPLIDARDVSRAMGLALEKTTIGEVYNLSGNIIYTAQNVVDILKNKVDFKFSLFQDPVLLRPTDEPIIFGDSTKFISETGWKPEIPLETTLEDMLDYWRGNLS